MFRFTKLALSGLTALSLSLTPVPASAAPDGDDIARALAGLAVLGIIATAVNDRSDRRRSTTRNNNARVNGPFATIEGSRVIDGEIRRPGDRKAKKKRKGVRKVALPNRCVRILSTSRGDRTVYGARCLRRDYIYAQHLPSSCKRQVRTRDRLRTVYGARCLHRDGWKVARN